MKVALFCVIRNEGRYVSEYIEYYLKLGFDHIYFCDNGNNGNMEEVCSMYKDKVSIIDLRTDKPIPDFVTYQAHLYTGLYNIFSPLYDWLCFFDMDELLEINKAYFKNVKDYLNLFKTVNLNGTEIRVDQIHVNWKVFDDNDHVYYEPIPMIKRFTRVSKKYYDIYGELATGIKTILRTGLDLHFNSCHTAVSNTDTPLYTINNDGLEFDESMSSHSKPTYKYAWLNHYLTRSTEEYINKNINNKSKDQFIEKYFKINEYSDEKYNILNSKIKEKSSSNHS